MKESPEQKEEARVKAYVARRRAEYANKGKEKERPLKEKKEEKIEETIMDLLARYIDEVKETKV